MTQKRTIRDIFAHLEELPWQYMLYLPRGVLSLDTEGILLDPDDVSPDQDLPDEAVDLGFEETLGVDDIRSIQENARLQGKRPSMTRCSRHSPTTWRTTRSSSSMRDGKIAPWSRDDRARDERGMRDDRTRGRDDRGMIAHEVATTKRRRVIRGREEENGEE